MWHDVYIVYVAPPSYQLILLFQITSLILPKLLPFFCAYVYTFTRYWPFTANILSYYPLRFRDYTTPSFLLYAIWQNI